MTQQHILGDLIVNGQGPEEDRKRALAVVLARWFEQKLDAQGRPTNLLTWNEACSGLTVRGFPVTQHQIKYWIKTTEWGWALWEQYAVTGPQLAAEQYDRLPELVARLFDAALDEATPVAVLPALVKAIIAFGDRLGVWEQQTGVAAQRPAIHLLQQFAGSVSLTPGTAE